MTHDTQINDGGPNDQLVSHGSFGMTLRDWFAGQAMLGMLSSVTVHAPAPSDETLSKWAYSIANTMLAARKQN